MKYTCAGNGAVTKFVFCKKLIKVTVIILLLLFE